MTFLHKLSRRLARLKPGMPVAAAAVSAAAAFVARAIDHSTLPTVTRLVVSPKTVTLAPDQSQVAMNEQSLECSRDASTCAPGGTDP